MSAQPEALPPLPDRAGLVGRYLTNDCHSKWFFVPERPAWGWARSEEAKLRGAESTEEVYTADQMRAYALAALNALQAVIDACAIYLKEGETPAQRIERDHRDALVLMSLLAQEKRKSEALLEFAQEVRRTGDTRLASMAIAIIAKAEMRA